MVGSKSRPGKSTTLPRTPDFQRIEEELRQRIIDGEFPLGSQLPTYAALAEHFGTSIQPVKVAILRLRIAGIVEGQPGKGVFVAAVPSAQ